MCLGGQCAPLIVGVNWNNVCVQVCMCVSIIEFINVIPML